MNFLKSSIKEFTTKNWKTGFNIDINVEDLKRFEVDRFGYVKFTMRPRKEKGRYWETHLLVENDFGREQPQSWQDNLDAIPDSWTRNDDLPF